MARSPNGNHLTALLPYLIVSVAPLCWAGNIVLARGVIHLIPPVTFAFWRWTLAFLILLPFAWRHAQADWQTARQHWRILILLAFLGISCFNTLLYTAVHTITAINGALIQTAVPAFIILISLLLFKERISFPQIIGVCACILGAALVVVRGQWQALIHMTFKQGDLLMIIAVILYAGYTALLRKRPPMHGFSFALYTFGAGAAGLLPPYIIEGLRVGWVKPTLPVVLSVLYVAVFPSVVGYLCWNKGAQRIGPNRTGLFTNLVPVFASILAVIWLDETLMAYHLWGMALIFGGMMLFNRTPAHPTR